MSHFGQRQNYDERAGEGVGPRSQRKRRFRALCEYQEFHTAGGATRCKAARIGDATLTNYSRLGCEVQLDGPQGLIDRKSPGQPSRLDDTYRVALAAFPAINVFVRWRIVDLSMFFQQCLRSSASRLGIRRRFPSADHSNEPPRSESIRLTDDRRTHWELARLYCRVKRCPPRSIWRLQGDPIKPRLGVDQCHFCPTPHDVTPFYFRLTITSIRNTRLAACYASGIA
jgi:hypothetical protein